MPEKETAAPATAKGSDAVPVTTLRDDPPANASAIAISTFIRLHAHAPARPRSAWVEAFSEWFDGNPSSKRRAAAK